MSLASFLAPARVPRWVFWAAPLVLILVAIKGFESFPVLPPDLGNYRVGDVYSTVSSTSVVTIGQGLERYVAATVGTMYPGHESLQYSLAAGTQVQVTAIRDVNEWLDDFHKMPPDVVARILNGPYAGQTASLTPISAVRDAGSHHPKADPSPTYLSLVTRGTGK